MTKGFGMGLAMGTLLALALHPPASAQMMRWTDDQGRVNYTQGIESVPERHRASATVVGATPALSAPGAPTDASASTAPTAPGATAAPGGVTRIPFTPGRPIMVSARINNGGTAELMLDTGAQVTVINPRVLAALGVGMRDSQRSTLLGVTGSADVLSVTLDSLEVAGARVGPLRVVSHDTGTGSGDGLLGRDFLDRFTVTIDNRGGFVTLAPR